MPENEGIRLISCPDCHSKWFKDGLSDRNGVIYCPECDSKIGLADWKIQEAKELTFEQRDIAIDDTRDR